MDKRQFIRDKSVYNRKVSRLDQLLDEIQLKWILFMMRKEKVFFCEDARPNVRVLLEKYGKVVEDTQGFWWKISHDK
ncbi:MAG: hypothetical protein J6A29_05050 [Clostridia bacterium]|nr:hypothetical protein [Clostridia bacterium]